MSKVACSVAGEAMSKEMPGLDVISRTNSDKSTRNFESSLEFNFASNMASCSNRFILGIL